MKNKWQCLVAAILISLLVAEIVWYSPYGTSGKGSFAILHVVSQSQGEMTDVSIAYQLNASFPMNATVVITPVKEDRQDLPIYVFYDTDYPTVGTDWILSAMLQGHLKAELYLREYSDDVKLANAEELEGLMSMNKSAIVIMASGAFPSCIFSKEKNLVLPWIESGGILVWLGYYIGYYVVEKGMKGEQVTYNMSQNLRENGSTQLGLKNFFGYYALEDNPKVAEYSSDVSRAIDTTYALIQQAPLLHMVMGDGGIALGMIGGESPTEVRSSISMVPMGKGKIIIFGFFLMPGLAWNGPELVAWDMAQIICSGVLQMDPDSAPWFQSYHLSEGKTTTDVSSFLAGSGIVGFVVYEYTSRESEGILFSRKFVRIQNES
jgi:hypothetical protein